MTLEEAIKHLQETITDDKHEWSCEACKQEHEQLLGWLEELKAYKEAPKGDLISRDALKEKLINMFSDYEYVTQKDSYLIELLELIEDAPTVSDRVTEVAEKCISLGRKLGKLEGQVGAE